MVKSGACKALDPGSIPGIASNRKKRQMIRKWQLSSSRFGFKVRTYEVPRHAVLLESVFDKACWLTGGWLGGHGMPEKFWEIPVGRAVYDEEGYLENSIASKFFDLEQAVFTYSFKRETNAVEIEITAEQARAIDPEFVGDMEEIGFLPDDYTRPEVPSLEPAQDNNVLQFKKP